MESPTTETALNGELAGRQRKSHSKVTNYLGSSRLSNEERKPGNFRYTNKERIEEDFNKEINKIDQVLDTIKADPKLTQNATSYLISEMETALKSETARKVGVVTLTLPIVLVQVCVKILRVITLLLGLFTSLVPVLHPKKSVGTFNTSENLTKKIAKKLGVPAYNPFNKLFRSVEGRNWGNNEPPKQPNAGPKAPPAPPTETEYRQLHMNRGGNIE